MFSNNIPRSNFYDLSVPYLQQNLTVSETGYKHKIIQAEVKFEIEDKDERRLLATDEI